MQKIMVVDNHPLIRKFMTDFLEKKGYEVASAPDGLSALQLLETYAPEIFFIDLIMPNISGDKLCRIIRARYGYNQCFIVVVSAVAVEEDVYPENVDADMILAKGPFDKLSAHVVFILDKIKSGNEQDLKGRIVGRDDMFERQISKELLDIKNHYEITLKHMSEGLLEIVDNKIVYANKAARLIIDFKEKELLASDLINLFQQKDQIHITKRLYEAIHNQREVFLDQIVMPNGKIVSIQIIPAQKKNRRYTTLVLLRDITVEKQAELDTLKSQEKYEQENKFLENVFENSADAIAILDEHGGFTRCNRQMSRLLGYDFKELINKKAFEIFADREAMKKMTAELRRSENINDYEIELKCKDGAIMPCAVSASLLRDENGQKTGSLSIIRDLSKWKQTEEKLRFLSFHDYMTGLYNRGFFEEEAQRLLVERHLPVGIIMCDINRLKVVNDTLGHQKGDELIKSTADILKRSFRSSDVIGRIGGDEFAILLPASTKQAVISRINRIMKEIEQYNSDHPEQNLSIAIGYAVSDEMPLDMQALFKEADDKMYAEKIKGK